MNNVFTTQSWPLITLKKKETFWKHRRKRRKCWLTAFLLFPQRFLSFPKQIFHFSFTYNLLSANTFNLDQGKILSFWKELTVYQITKFRLIHIESICRWQNKWDWKIEVCLGKVENILGKGENAGTSIFSFSQNVFKRPFPQGSLKVNSLTHNLDY